MKPYDHVHGYQTILGNTQVSSLTMANFEGPSACGGAPDGPVYAMSNHQNAPDAAHPVFVKQVCGGLRLLGVRFLTCTIWYSNWAGASPACQKGSCPANWHSVTTLASSFMVVVKVPTSKLTEGGTSYAGLQVTKVSVTDEGLFHMYSPDPDWRNEADCGMAEYKRPDGSTLPLNCAGPKHAYFR